MNYLRCLKASNSFLQFNNYKELTNISKLSCKYSTANNSEASANIPAASRWRNVRGCVKPESKQKQLKFSKVTQHSPVPFDLLKSKQQLQITC